MTSAHEQDLRHAPRPWPNDQPIPPWRVWICPRSVDTCIALRRRAVAEKRRKFGHDFGEGAVRLVPFKPLTHPEIERIADLMFNDLRTWLAERGITLDPTEDAPIDPQTGFDPVYGTPPLRRFIGREVETPIGHALLAGDACSTPDGAGRAGWCQHPGGADDGHIGADQRLAA